MEYRVIDMIVHAFREDQNAGVVSAQTFQENLTNAGKAGWTIATATATGHDERGTHWAILMQRPALVASRGPAKS